jgi:predicted ABC-type ATPase
VTHRNRFVWELDDLVLVEPPTRAMGRINRDAHSDWMDECVPELMGYGKDQLVAVAACMNMWRDAWEESHPDGADDPGPDRPQPDDKQLDETIMNQIAKRHRDRYLAELQAEQKAARLKSQWAREKERSLKLLQKYDPNQPRAPSAPGHSGGEFASTGGGGDSKSGKSRYKDASGNSVPFEPSPFTKQSKDPTSASALLQIEWSVQVADLEAKVAEKWPKVKEQGAAARVKVKKEPDTQSLYKTVPTDKKDAKGRTIFKYDPQRAAVHHQIVDRLMPQSMIDAARPKPGEQPTLYILGGRGGSGKGWFTDEGGTLAGEMENSVYINNDNVKEALPEWQGYNAGPLHEEASDIGEDMEKFARDNKLNTIVDATLKSEESLAKRIALYKAAGYKISGHYMYASPATAAERALGRFASGNEKDGKGRFVPPEYSLESITNENSFDSHRDQMDYWEVYDNMGKYPEPPKLHSRKGGKK